MNEKHLLKSDILRKDAGQLLAFFIQNATLPQVFFIHFTNEYQVPSFSITRTLEHRLLIS